MTMEKYLLTFLFSFKMEVGQPGTQLDRPAQQLVVRPLS